MWFLFLIGVGALLGLLFFMRQHSRSLQHHYHQTGEAWHEVNYHFERRADVMSEMIPIIESFHDLLGRRIQEVVVWREQARATRNVRSQVDAEVALTEALESFFAHVEKLPERLEHHGYVEHQNSLQWIDSDIQASGRQYNAAVETLRSMMDRWSHRVVAEVIGLDGERYVLLP